MSRAF